MPTFPSHPLSLSHTTKPRLYPSRFLAYASSWRPPPAPSSSSSIRTQLHHWGRRWCTVYPKFKLTEKAGRRSALLPVLHLGAPAQQPAMCRAVRSIRAAGCPECSTRGGGAANLDQRRPAVMTCSSGRCRGPAAGTARQKVRRRLPWPRVGERGVREWRLARGNRGWVGPSGSGGPCHPRATSENERSERGRSFCPYSARPLFRF